MSPKYHTLKIINIKINNHLTIIPVMKTTLLKLTSVLLICMPFMLQAQKNPMDVLFEKYVGKEGFTSVAISKDLFLMFNDIDTAGCKDAGEFRNIVGKLDGLKVLSYKMSGKDDPFNFYNEIIKTFPMASYTNLMEVNESGETVKFYVRKNGPKINELLMIASEPGETTALSISGDIDLSSISKLSKSIHLEGMENLNKIKEDKDNK
jgi:hypothetical protein